MTYMVTVTHNKLKVPRDFVPKKPEINTRQLKKVIASGNLTTTTQRFCPIKRDVLYKKTNGALFNFSFND